MTKFGPTPKQISFALHLLEEKGFGSRWMSAKFSELGATMRERSGSVESWLTGMTRSEISRLIDTLIKRS